MTTVDWKVLKREARRQDTTPERRLELAHFAPDLAREVARSQNTPPDVLATLAQHPDLRVRLALASNPRTPLALLVAFCRSSDMELLVAVAGNKSTPPTELETLAQHRNTRIQGQLASNPSIPLDVLTIIASRSGNLPIQGLKILVEYGDNAPCANLDKTVPDLIKGMALSELIPAGAARRLLDHPSTEIRQTLHRHVDKVATSIRAQIKQQLMQEGAHP